VALRTTCIKNVKFKAIKIKTGCQYVGYYYYSEHLSWAAQNLKTGPPVGHIFLKIALWLRVDSWAIAVNDISGCAYTFQCRGQTTCLLGQFRFLFKSLGPPSKARH